jgi:PAS domain S-box-containing protein
MATTRHDDKGTGVPLTDAEQQAVLRESERGLRAKEEHLHSLLEGAGLGHWDYDYVSDTLVWSEQTRRLLGVEPGEPASRVLLRSRMHAEDRLRFREYVARRAYVGADHICNFEFRVVTPNGAIRWLRIRAGWKRMPQGCRSEPAASYAISPHARMPRRFRRVLPPS